MCDIALAETAAALSRKKSEGEITDDEAKRTLTSVVEHFLKDPRPFLVIQSSSIMQDVPSVTQTHTLKSSVAIQLAAALAARQLAPLQTDFYFACTDKQLCRAAKAENFNVLEPGAVAAGGA